MAGIFENLIRNLDLIIQIECNNNWDISVEQYEEALTINSNLNEEYIIDIIEDYINQSNELILSKSSSIIWGDDQHILKCGLTILVLYIQIPSLLCKHDSLFTLGLSNILLSIKVSTLYIKLICLEGSQIYNVYQIQILNKIVAMINSISNLTCVFGDNTQSKTLKRSHAHHPSQDYTPSKKKMKMMASDSLSNQTQSQSSTKNPTHSLPFPPCLDGTSPGLTKLLEALIEFIQAWGHLYQAIPWSKFGSRFGLSTLLKIQAFAFRAFDNYNQHNITAKTPSYKKLFTNPNYTSEKYAVYTCPAKIDGSQKISKPPFVILKQLNESVYQVFDISLQVAMPPPDGNGTSLIFKDHVEKIFGILLQQLLTKGPSSKSSRHTTWQLNNLHELNFQYTRNLWERSKTSEDQNFYLIVQVCLYRLAQHLTISSSSSIHSSTQPASVAGVTESFAPDDGTLEGQQGALGVREGYARILTILEDLLDVESRVKFRFWLAKISKANKSSYKTACADLINYLFTRRRQHNHKSLTSVANFQAISEANSFYLSTEYLLRIVISSCDDCIAGVRNKSISSLIKYLESIEDDPGLLNLVGHSNTTLDVGNYSTLSNDVANTVDMDSEILSKETFATNTVTQLRECRVQLEMLEISKTGDSVSVMEEKTLIESMTTQQDKNNTDTIIERSFDNNSNREGGSRRSKLLSFSDLSRVECLTAYQVPTERVEDTNDAVSPAITLHHIFVLLNERMKQDSKAHVRRVAIDAMEKLIVRLLELSKKVSTGADVLIKTSCLMRTYNIIPVIANAAVLDKSVMVQKQALSTMTNTLIAIAQHPSILSQASASKPLTRLRRLLEKAWIQTLLVCSSHAVLHDKCCEIFDRIILRNFKPLPTLPSRTLEDSNPFQDGGQFLAWSILSNFVDKINSPPNLGIGDNNNALSISQETQPYSLARNLFCSLLSASIKARLLAASASTSTSSATLSSLAKSSKTPLRTVGSTKRDGHNTFWRHLVITLESYFTSPYDKPAWFMMALVCQLKPDIYCSEVFFDPSSKTTPKYKNRQGSLKIQATLSNNNLTAESNSEPTRSISFNQLLMQTENCQGGGVRKPYDVISHWSLLSQKMCRDNDTTSGGSIRAQPCTMIDVLAVVRCFVTCRSNEVSVNDYLSKCLASSLTESRDNEDHLPTNILSCLRRFEWPTCALCTALIDAYKCLCDVATVFDEVDDSDSESRSDDELRASPITFGKCVKKVRKRDSPLGQLGKLGDSVPRDPTAVLREGLRQILRSTLTEVRAYVLACTKISQGNHLSGDSVPTFEITKLLKHIYFMGECVLAFPNFLTKSLYNTILCLIIDERGTCEKGESRVQEDDGISDGQRKSFLGGLVRSRSNYSFQHISRRSEKDLNNDDSSFSSHDSSINMDPTDISSSPENKNGSPKIKDAKVISNAQPSSVRAHAFLALGKFCLINELVAKKSIPAIIWELDSSKDEMVQNSIMMILMDFIKRYPNATDPYVPIILAICLHPSYSSCITRYQCLTAFLRLLREAYVPWNKVLFLKLITLCVDPSPKIRSLARGQLVPFIACAGNDGTHQRGRRHVNQSSGGTGTGVNHPGSGHTTAGNNLFYNYFLDTIFFLNAFYGRDARQSFMARDNNKYQPNKPENSIFTLPGTQNFEKRLTIYNIYLEHLKDDQKFLLTARICSDILAPIADKSSEFPWDDTIRCILRDAFSVLTCPAIQLSILSSTGGPGASIPGGVGVGKGRKHYTPDEEHDDEALDQNVQNRVMEETRKGLVSQILKKNVVENILPILLTLKRYLEKLKSPLLKDLRSYLLWIAKSFPDEVEEVFATQPELAEDMEYHSKRDQILKRMSQKADG